MWEIPNAINPPSPSHHHKFIGGIYKPFPIMGGLLWHCFTMFYPHYPYKHIYKSPFGRLDSGMSTILKWVVPSGKLT